MGVDPGCLDGGGEQRHRIERLRRLADPSRDLIGGDPRAEELARLAVAAARREDGRGQVADAGKAGEGLDPGAGGYPEVNALAPDLRRGDAGGVEAVRRRGRRREGGGVLRRPGDLDADDVIGPLADEPGAVEALAEVGP